MYISNQYKAPEPGLNYLKLRKNEKFLFPHECKYVSWGFLGAIMIISTIIQIYFGVFLGSKKTFSWLTEIIATFAFALLLFTPLQICFFVFFDAFFLKLKTVIGNRKVETSLVENPVDAEKQKEIERMRKCYKQLYSPMSLDKLQCRLEDLKLSVAMRNLGMEILNLFAFVLIICFVATISKLEMGFYNGNVVKSLVVEGHYTNSIPFTEATTYERFLEYLGETLFPALMLNREEYQRKERKNNFIKKYNFYNGTNMLEKGWTMDPAVKLLGVPRLRQLRTSGGYILNLEKAIQDSRNLIDFFNEFHWVNAHTRIVFVEFTTYCVNTNVFVFVTLVLERTCTGYFVPSFQIEPCKFIFLFKEMKMMQVFGMTLFTIFLFYFVSREGLRMMRTSTSLYFTRGSLLLNASLAISGISTLVSAWMTALNVNSFLDELDKFDPENFYLSFGYPVSWLKRFIFLEALTIFIASFKLVGLLSYRVILYRVYATVSHCFIQFIHFVNQILISVGAYFCLFYVSLLLHDYLLSDFIVYGTSAKAKSNIGPAEIFQIEIFFCGSRFMLVVCSLLFLFVFIIASLNIFLAIVCSFYHLLSNESFANKYDIKKYFKYILTRNERTDIFRLNYEIYNSEYRFLKGEEGGPIKKYKNKIDKNKDIMEIVSARVKIQRFIAFQPTGLTWTQIILMKALTVAILTENKTQKILSRQTALKARFSVLTSEKSKENRGSMEVEMNENKFFSFSRRKVENVISIKKLTDMKRLVETFAGVKDSPRKETKNYPKLISRIRELVNKLEFLLKNKIK